MTLTREMSRLTVLDAKIKVWAGWAPSEDREGGCVPGPSPQLEDDHLHVHMALSFMYEAAPKFLFLILYCHSGIFFIVTRQEGREAEKGEKYHCEREISIGCLLICVPTGDQTHNLGMCPDWELNPGHFGLWDDATTKWAILARVKFVFFMKSSVIFD